MTTREIEDHLREMYDIEVSPQFISRATERMQSEITEWQNRPLDAVYPVVYVDGLRVSVRSGNNSGSIIKKCGVRPLSDRFLFPIHRQEADGGIF